MRGDLESIQFKTLSLRIFQSSHAAINVGSVKKAMSWVAHAWKSVWQPNTPGQKDCRRRDVQWSQAHQYYT